LNSEELESRYGPEGLNPPISGDIAPKPFLFLLSNHAYGLIDFAFASKILIHTSPLVNSE
jgi:hypothetical protein